MCFGENAGKEKSMGKKDSEKAMTSGISKNGQAAKLNKNVKETYRVVIVGAALLIVFTIANILYSMVSSEQLETTMFLNQYRLGSKTLTSEVQSYAVTGNSIYYDNYIKELETDKNRDIALEGLKKNDITAEEWDSLNQIASLSEGLVPLEEKAIELASNGQLEEAMAQVFGTEYEETVQQISILTDECIETIQKRMNNKQNIISILMIISEVVFVLSFIYIVLKVQHTIKFAKNELLAPIIKVSEQLTELAKGNFRIESDLKEDDSEVGKMVASIHFMKQNYTNMITEIADVLGAMGQGNYNVQVTQEYVGEFVKIKDSMLKIVADTRKTLLTIKDVAQEIDGGSEQLAKASVDLAEGCTVQAGKVSEVASMVDEMTRSMEEKAQGAQKAVEIFSKTGAVLQAGNARMQELKEAISEISKCSEEISTIIATIEEIANQTNLLSLNAAIEAARAGEAGKGFAVVADQVKNLAEESAKAAGETTKLIQMTVDAVNKGIGIADATAENMEDVVVGAKEATEKMEQMAAALRQEANNMSLIDDNICRVSEIVDNNSATSEETAAVSEEQSAQVTMMVELMQQFEI